MHYFWVGAVPAMLFLGVVMMPFYYGSKVRSVPEFMNRRFGSAAHLVNAISFAVAQLLIAGINLYLLASIVEVLLGWPLWVSLVVAAAIVLTYTALGGLSAAIYNEVLQFFVIVAALLPLTLVGLNKVGGWEGLKEEVAGSPGGAEQLSSWPGTALSGFDSSVLSVVGIVFGLGFVLSFGYWTTNFVEVQRAMASNSMSAAQRSPIIGSFPKMFVPFIVVIPGMIAAVTVAELVQLKEDGSGGATYNDSILFLMRDLLPNGMLGVAIAGLLASFMAGMAANISAFNTVFSYDLWQTYLVKDKNDSYYTRVGRVATVGATVVAVGTATFAASYSNIMTYLQTLFGFFNAPLFATFILGMFWKRMTATAGWTGLVAGTAAAVGVWVLSEDVLGVIGIGEQGGAFVAAGAAFVVDIVVSVVVSLGTRPKPERELEGLVYSKASRAKSREDYSRLPWHQQPARLAGVALVMVVALNILFW
jgi:SSS family solute:Na+ symporter